MSSHSCTRIHSPLKVDAASLLQAPQICPAECLGCDAHLKLIFPELCDGQTSAVDAYAVAEVCIAEDVGAVGDGQGGAFPAAGGLVELRQARDRWLDISTAPIVPSNGIDNILPTVSTMPVNILKGRVEGGERDHNLARLDEIRLPRRCGGLLANAEFGIEADAEAREFGFHGQPQHFNPYFILQDYTPFFGSVHNFRLG